MFVNNSYNLDRDSLITVRSNISNQQIGGLKELTQAQRRILKLAVLILNNEGSGLTISKETGLKIIEPSNYEKSLCATINKSVHKIFNKDYIDFNELSDLVNGMELDDNQKNII